VASLFVQYCPLVFEDHSNNCRESGWISCVLLIPSVLPRIGGEESRFLLWPPMCFENEVRREDVRNPGNTIEIQPSDHHTMWMTWVILSACLWIQKPYFSLARVIDMAWTLQGVESVPRGCWPMLTPILPTFVSNWLGVLWVVNHSWYTRETVECEKPSSVADLDTLKLVPLAPTSITPFKVT
jgi:hypothetical protein